MNDHSEHVRHLDFIRRHDSGICVFDPDGSFELDLSEARFRHHKDFLVRAISQDVDDFQSFLRGYLGMTAGHPAERKTESLNRFAMNVELLRSFIPPSGRWLDLGAFGHDAICLSMLRADIEQRLYSYPGTGTKLIFDNEVLRYARHGEAPEAVVEDLDFERAPIPEPDASFDVISSFETIEHFKFGPQSFMRECARVLKPGGLLIASTPNMTSAASIARILAGDSPNECRLYHRNIKLGRVHPIEYDYAQIRALFTSCGFELMHFLSVNLREMDADQLEAAKLADRFCRVFVSGKRHIHFGHLWYVIAKRGEPAEFSYPAAVFDS
jgi:SAM-dependent methyltransferase